ncbi:hypothetical protein ECE50_019065 [Chitinophaga sp. Mgbs1]|uniref:Uncharacterized protein n=1 Tax=Chitinophaga solisilvae TaxID=1233460 RepID=A0A3S1D0L5_9BACT|nr:hypothetical protein [Chitinophaga solisilvae]
MNRKILAALFLILCTATVYAQEKDSTATTGTDKLTISFGKYPKHRQKMYVTTNLSGMVSFASMKDNGEYLRNIPRFSFVFNYSTNFNKDFSRHFGVFTGFGIKNIGLISKPTDSLKLKQRVYTIGIPVGFKIGDVTGGTFFFFAGGEIDMAVNYKEKQFVNGRKEHKFNEWFSDRTPLLMPSVFAGFRINPGFGLKVQYYPQNFFNRDFNYSDKGTKVYPYKNLDANMVLVTLGYNFDGVNYFKVKKKRHYLKMKSGKTEFEVNY